MKKLFRLQNLMPSQSKNPEKYSSKKYAENSPKGVNQDSIWTGSKSPLRKSLRGSLTGWVLGTTLLACAPVKFDKIPPVPCQGLGDSACVHIDGVEQYNDTLTIGDGKVDILFVDDNSGSMSTEQKALSTRFSDFVSSLGNLDYHIAVTTTDVEGVAGFPDPSSRAANGFGKFRDGFLLEFSSGLKFLERSTSDAAALFLKTIVRDETRECENSGFTNCPSPDERGIYAANLAVDRNENGFIRQGAHLAVVFLSDEDERSGPEVMTQHNLSYETNDLPDTLISKVQTKYPGKTFSAHSIIVKPGDSACLSEQTGQSGNAGVKGFGGTRYAELSNKTGGHIGSICNTSNYTAEVGKIGYNIVDQTYTLKFKCRPIDDQFVTNLPSTSYSVNMSSLEFQVSKSIQPGSIVKVSYKCKANAN